jgi:para-nitrobenzyl esterase
MTVEVTTTAGRLRGSSSGGVSAFLGIPYAAPPFGNLRFRAPAPAQPWDGVRDAVEYGPTVPKPPYPHPIDTVLPEPVIAGDECLNLNVWTPDPGGRGLPVLVWIHGGAFVNGSGAVSTYDGSRFARDGVVCVTINYRLGVDGFLHFGAVGDDAGVPANRGLLDQVAALEWVRDNIASFGGDPSNVTIAGESAGAMSVTSLLSMPRARGLFRRAIAQSGAGQHVLGPATAGKVAAALAERLGVPATPGGLAGVPIDSLVAEQAKLSARIAQTPDPQQWNELVVNAMAFEPTVDGDVLPARPLDAIRSRAGAGVDVLIGSNAQEFRLFLVPPGLIDFVNDDLVAMAVAGYGADPEKLLAAYRPSRPAMSPGELLSDVASDWFFTIPAVRVAEARPDPTYLYEFAWPSPQFGGRLQACHALEVGFVFDNLDDPAGEPLAGKELPQHLADEMHGAWVSFATSGEPGWATYGTERTVMRFADPSELVLDPHADERRAWEGIR